ncbi:DksA/TraR family C4-type zinc finger protein [Yersinia enterocolitica]|nr:DksA/TraR family C4-type zinc finger protein [Yersinia enterocolitica]HEI6791948.1 DksA/TraR family C4-type zinc finger protein [Yersinia enterocolitica]HEI6808589.1 DksA/TraR family C4-type zinc finger protein [Yersinia enterocolitica]
MASGWAGDGAVQEQIDSTLEDAIERARLALGKGDSDSEIYCLECGQIIPEARRKALAGVKHCLACQNELDKRQTTHSGYNRRGSKDSQLR